MAVKHTPIATLNRAAIRFHADHHDHLTSFGLCTHEICVDAREAIADLAVVMASRDVDEVKGYALFLHANRHAEPECERCERFFHIVSPKGSRLESGPMRDLHLAESTSMNRSLEDIADTGVAWCTEAEFAALITKVKALEAERCGHTLDGSPCLMEADHPGSHCEVPGMMLVAVQAKLKAREISLKVVGTCEVCWTNSWEPTLNEEECLAEHPHPEMDCIRCGQCSLFTTYKALTEALADAETENERLRELIDCNNEWRDA